MYDTSLPTINDRGRKPQKIADTHLEKADPLVMLEVDRLKRDGFHAVPLDAEGGRDGSGVGVIFADSVPVELYLAGHARSSDWLVEAGSDVDVHYHTEYMRLVCCVRVVGLIWVCVVLQSAKVVRSW